MVVKKDDIEVCDSFKSESLKLEIELNWGMVHDNLVAGIEGGVRSWARINVGKHEPGWANYFTAEFEDIADGGTKSTCPKCKGEETGVSYDCDRCSGYGTITVHKKYKLSREKLKKGLLVLYKQYPHHFADIIRESGDATTGDVLIQCALLGDIVYG